MDGRVEVDVGGGDLHHETGAAFADDKALNQAAGMKALARFRVDDAVEGGDDLVAVWRGHGAHMVTNSWDR